MACSCLLQPFSAICIAAGNKCHALAVWSREHTLRRRSVSNETLLQSRRSALKCLAYGSAGTLFTLAGGVLSPIDLAFAGTDKMGGTMAGVPLFVQISDTHI